MNENFGLNVAAVDHPRNLLPGHLPGQHHPLKSHLLHLQCAFQIVYRHLGGGVQRQLGADLLQQRNHSHILHDHRIHIGAAGLFDHLHRLGDFAVVHEGVEGQMDPHIPLVAVFYRFLQGKVVKVGGVAPGVEHLRPKIYRIGAAAHRGFHRRESSCRR